jgi:hypothetical protein
MVRVCFPDLRKSCKWGSSILYTSDLNHIPFWIGFSGSIVFEGCIISVRSGNSSGKEMGRKELE